MCVRGREGGKKKDAGSADTFCGEANGNVLSLETTTLVLPVYCELHSLQVILSYKTDPFCLFLRSK